VWKNQRQRRGKSGCDIWKNPEKPVREVPADVRQGVVMTELKAVCEFKTENESISSAS